LLCNDNSNERQTNHMVEGCLYFDLRKNTWTVEASITILSHRARAFVAI